MRNKRKGFILLLFIILLAITFSACHSASYKSDTTTSQDHYSSEAISSYSAETTTEEVEDIEPQWLTCSDCNGEGSFVCAACGGTGDAVCSSCGGSGKVACIACNGSGSDYLSPYGGSCGICHGTGKSQCYSCAYATCLECYGSGTDYCNHCGGNGYVENPNYVSHEHYYGGENNYIQDYPSTPDIDSTPMDCPMCENGKLECSLCYGKGYTEKTETSIDLGAGGTSYTVQTRCRACSGTGDKSCSYCGGTGVLN